MWWEGTNVEVTKTSGGKGQSVTKSPRDFNISSITPNGVVIYLFHF